MRVVVTGGRDYTDAERVRNVLDTYHAQRPFSVLIVGRAPGLDTLAEEWAISRTVPVLPFPAAWTDLTTPPVSIRTRRDGTLYNAAAGAIRNGRMLAEGRPDVCLSFPGGSGTADMTKRAIVALGRERVLLIPPGRI